MMQQNLASIDIGTNTLRLWIGKIKDKKILTLHTDRANVRLGEGLKQQGVINEKAVARAAPILARFREAMEKRSVDDLRAIGTSVFRKAGNGEETIQRLYNQTGVPIDIISGEEEASLSVKGILWNFPQSCNRAMVVDAGGGSTELIIVRDYRIEAVHSIDLGAVYLTETCFEHDPPLDKEIEGLRACVAEQLGKVTMLAPFKDIICEGGYRLVGTAGTATTLAAMDLALCDYISELVHGHVLTINKLLALFDRLGVKKARDRLVLAGLEPGREDIILAGLIIWIGILKAFSLPEMTVSHNGILEGIAIDLWERNKQKCYTK
jgi:exopolyphosphatase/guanosine-5'-triphosphate,3'-diphosphate pyrophosphatase